MAIELVMPRLGWTMEEGVLVEWLKNDGDQVEIGDSVYTVETDKALNEVEALDAGTLGIPPNSPAPGTMLPVGTVIGFLLEPGEEMPELPELIQPPAPASAPASAPAPAGSAVAAVGSPNISPRARRIAIELGVDWTQLQGSGSTGRIVERDVRAAVPLAQTEVKASPVARRLAEQLGVDLAQIAATKKGRIEKADVEAASSQQSGTAPSRALAADRQRPMSPVRRITAERMSASARTTAPVTLNSEVDATEIVRLRTQLKNDVGDVERVVPSYNDLLVKAAAQALTEHPEVNARLLESGDIEESAAVHVGIAVDTERGLLVPVLTDADAKTLLQVTSESADLIAAASAGGLGPDALQGGTFTITNLGMFDIDGFTPIINLPECAILGVGRIVPKQVVTDLAAERVEIRHMMVISLTFDHRLVDGAPAARFLQRLKQLVEQPYLWLVS